MNRVFALFAITMFGLLWASSSADAQVRATCAQVRCATGGCIDTPDGPVCGAKTTCASTLCSVGNICVETAQGAQCVPSSQPQYTPPQYTPPQYYQRPYYRPRRPHYSQRRFYNPRRYYGWRHNGYYQNWYPPRPQPRPAPPIEERPTACTMQYDPVCAQKQVQCVRAPCPPVTRTFGNACEAAREDFTVLYAGTCR